MNNPEEKNLINPEKGSILIYCIVIIFIFSMVMLGLLDYSAIQLKTTRDSVSKEQAFQIAEAGANYYVWRLSHFQNDFWDGNASTTPGPYVHSYNDTDQATVIGQFSLSITPPLVGSTIVTVKSTGFTLADPQIKRTVSVRYGIPSLAQYAFLTNSDAWIGSGESVSGQFFSNGGVRFDGTGNAPIMSAKTTYTCTSFFGCSPNATKAGIWGAAAQSTKNFWQFPQPNVDFSSITGDLAVMKSSAQTAGIYLPPSNKQGYSLVFKVDGTVDFFTVTSLVSGEPSGIDVNNVTHNNSLDYQNRSFLYNKAIPQNGIIYAEDNVWVEGTVKGRAMVAAAKLPYNSATAPSILIKNSIIYAAKDGTNVLGLIAQQDFLVTYQSANNLEIDAAFIAQNGSAERYYYSGSLKNSIVIFGSLGSFGSWTWSWVNCDGCAVNNGYSNTSTVYDGNLIYAPPPSFPLTSNGYQQISWGSN